MAMFVTALKDYLSMLKAKARPGADTVNQEAQLVKAIMGITKESVPAGGVLTLSVGDYRVINEVLWKRWAALGQHLRNLQQSSLVKGEHEPEEKELEDLRQLLELPPFTVLPRRKLLVDDFANFYMTGSDQTHKPQTSHPELAKDGHGRKYLISGGRKYYVPDPATRNALGYDETDFVALSPRELSAIPNGDGPIESVRQPQTRLIRSARNHDSIFVIFSRPTLHRRHVPDPQTLKAMGRRQGNVEVVSADEMDAIDELPELRSSTQWDTVAQPGHHSGGPTTFIGSNVVYGENNGHMSTTKESNQKSKPDSWWKSPLFLTILAAGFGLLIAYLTYALGWNNSTK